MHAREGEQRARGGRLRALALRLVLLASGTLAALAIAEVGLRVRDTVFDLNRLHFQADPTYGWRPLPNVSYHYSTALGTVELRANSRGMLEPERSAEKPAGTFRVLTLGDSFTQALEVRYEDRFTTRLERSLGELFGAPVEVINAGVQGYQADQEVLYYENEGWAFRPDVVLVMTYVGNDILGLLNTGTTEGGGLAQDKPRFHLDAGRLVLDPIRVPEGGLETGPWGRAAPRYSDPLQTIKYRLYRISALYRLLADRWYTFTHPPKVLGPADRVLYRTGEPGTETAEAWAIMEALLGRLRDDVTANDARLIVAIIPETLQSDQQEWQQFLDRYALDPREWDREGPGRQLLAICGRLWIDCLDLLPALQEAGSKAYVPEDRHFSPLGHEIVAREVQALFQRLGLLSHPEGR